MPISSAISQNKFKLIKKVMMFVDGGYVRKQMYENLKDVKFISMDDNKSIIEANLHFIFGKACEQFFPNTLADLIRIYYYDGISNDKKHENVRVYHKKLQSTLDLQVKTIKLVRSSKKNGYKQKGIDTLISIDMLSKAYENHYDIAFLVTGDSDLIPVINAVKDNAGKNVFGISFENSTAYDLKVAFDRNFTIDKKM